MKRILLLIFMWSVFLGITAQNSGSGGSCNGVTAISEDFENVILDSLPECWGRINPQNALSPLVTSSNENLGLDSKAVKFMGYRPQFLVLPRIDVPLSGLQLKFKMNKEGKKCGILQVGYMSDPTDSTTFVPLANYDNGNNYKEMFPRILYLDNVPDNGGANRYIAFRFGNVDSVLQAPEYYYWLDDIELSPISSCPQPVSATITDITTTSISVSWSPHTTSATNWSLEYKEASATTWSVASPNITINPEYTITGLTPSTPYKIRVRTVCGTSQQSDYTYVIGDVYTACEALSSLYETFEDVTDKTPICWSVITESSSYPAVVSANANNGLTSKSIRFSGYSGEFLITPKFGIPLSNLQLKFKLNSENHYNGIFQVGYMSDPSDIGTFVAIENCQPTEYKVFKQYILQLNSIPDNSGANRYIAFRYGDVGAVTQPTHNYYWLDDVEVLTAPSCLMISDLTASSLTSSSAEMSFTSNNGEQAWQYVITDDMSILEPSGLTPVDFTTNPFTITGLSANTTYRVWVRANCGSGNGFSEYASTTFKTECAAVAIGNSEWTEDFSSFNYNTIPTCWTGTKVYTSYGGYSYPAVSSNHRQSLKFGGNETQIIATPSFVEDVNTLEMEFDLLRTSTYSGQFEVGVLSDPEDENSFEVIQNVTSLISDDGAYQRFTISFANAPAGTHYIGFRQTATYNESYYVDNINVHLIPTCPKPLNLRAEVILGESATIEWTAGGTETAWAIEYKKETATEWTSVTNITNNSLYTIEGLLPQTTYQVRVKGLCTVGTDESFWTEAITFRTTCASEYLPFTEDFSEESIVPMDCWSHLKGLASDIFSGGSFSLPTSTNYANWIYGDDNYGLPAEKAKVNIYSSNYDNTYAWLITPLINVTDENIKLEFDLALTKYNSSEAPDNVSSDDKFMVIVSTDGGATWSASNATVWAEDGTGDHLLSEIGNNSTHISLNLSYSGFIKIAFYAESTAPGSDIDLHLDNISLSVLSITPPTVTTQVADNITSTTATLHKTVVGGSTPITSEGFRYKVSSDALWRNSTDGNLTGLISGTTYSFFAYAIAGGITYNGDTLQFTTTEQETIHPVVTTLAATNIQQMSATLNKNVVSDPSEPVVSEGWKYKSTTGNVWSSTTDSILIGLEPNTQYEFYAYATTALNTNGYTGDTLTFITLEQPTIVDLVSYNVNIYPNPANDVVYIQVEGLDSEAEVTILDLQGKVLSRYNIDFNKNSLTLNVSNLADATYIVRIKSENIDITKRLIIKK